MRDDKAENDATGPEQVRRQHTFLISQSPLIRVIKIAEMYERQALAQSKGGKKKGGGDVDDGFW